MTFVLIPGAGGDAWYWHRLVAELERRDREAVAVDLPAGDDAAGWAEYADAVVAAARGAVEPVLVAQSMGGFTAPIVADRLPVRLLVLVNAMIPLPGETGGRWWGATGQAQARAELAAAQGRAPADDIDVVVDFFHDVPAEVTAEAMRRGGPAQSGTPFDRPWPLDRWPDVPTRVLAGRDDRLFPLEFQRRVARERLGLPVDDLPGGHCVALSRPVELADRLEAYAADPGRAPAHPGSRPRADGAVPA
jgi:pimeloyl-ACP methyl ester carboxylesterase